MLCAAKNTGQEPLAKAQSCRVGPMATGALVSCLHRIACTRFFGGCARRCLSRCIACTGFFDGCARIWLVHCTACTALRCDSARTRLTPRIANILHCIAACPTFLVVQEWSSRLQQREVDSEKIRRRIFCHGKGRYHVRFSEVPPN